MTLRKGETVRLVLSTEDGEHCFAVDEFRLEKRVVPGRTTIAMCARGNVFRSAARLAVAIARSPTQVGPTMRIRSGSSCGRAIGISSVFALTRPRVAFGR